VTKFPFVRWRVTKSCGSCGFSATSRREFVKMTAAAAVGAGFLEAAAPAHGAPAGW
jgi:hypothetical protein